MKRSKPTTEFWTVLTIVNVLGLIYPIRLAGPVPKAHLGRSMIKMATFGALQKSSCTESW